MENKPEYTDDSKTGNLAVSYIQTYFEEFGWIFRRLDGTNDFGIDAEIEIVDKNKVTGKLIKCQIKGTGSIDFDNGEHALSIKSTTWNNWKAINIPVVCLLCNVKTKNIYWTLPLRFEPKKDAASVSLKFLPHDNFVGNFNQFTAIIKTWINAFPKHNILLELPFFHNMYVEVLEPLIDWGDPWCGIGDETFLQVRVFYSHVLELRSSVGLTNEKIVPYELWLIRNQGMWDEVTDLYHGTFSELMSYIGHYYKEAVSKLQQRLNAIEPGFEHNDILHYFKSSSLRDEHVIYHYHPYGDEPKFHQYIEAKLKEVGYSKFKWNNKETK